MLAFVESRKAAPTNGAMVVRLAAASPKARRIAAERGVELTALRGSGPGGAVLVADVPAVAAAVTAPLTTAPLTTAPLTLHFDSDVRLSCAPDPEEATAPA